MPEPAAATKVRYKYPFRTMEVGELIFVPDMTTMQMSSYAGAVGRKLGRKFRTQTAHMRQDLQTYEWEPVRAGSVGSRKGVAICRVK